ncbi:caspase recruitment domain-containing protein 14 [Mactra antiquata]
MGRLIKVKYSLIKDVEFIGGNHTGIFVSKACKPLELNEGEQVCAVSITPQERINPVKMSTTGCTLQDFLQIVKGDLINKKKEREIVLEMKNSRQEYVFACEWMKNNNGHGDYFFVRCNVYVDRRGDDDTSLHPGEIYLVKNTCHDIDHWLTHNVDPISGKMSMATTLIPNKQHAQVRRLSHGRSLDEEDKIKRGGFKVKGSVYDRVVPLKAIIKLPIFVVGPDTSLITAFLNLIRTTLSDTYIVHMKQSDDGYHRDSMEDTEISRQDLHVVMPGSLELIKSRTIDCIFIFLNVTTHISHTDLMTLFDIEYDEMRHQDLVTQSMFIKDQVLETKHNLGEICIPPVNTKDSLIRKFHTSVTTAQERLLWLSSSEIDEQIAVKYPSYLGQYCDLNKLSQRGQSFYQN